MLAKDWLCDAKSSNVKNSNQIPDFLKRSVLGNSTRSIITSASLYNGTTTVRNGNILSGENSSVSQETTNFSNPTESQGLCNGHSSVIPDAAMLDRGTLHSSAIASSLQNQAATTLVQDSGLEDQSLGQGHLHQIRDA